VNSVLPAQAGRYLCLHYYGLVVVVPLLDVYSVLNYSEDHWRSYYREIVKKLLIRGLINILNSDVKIKVNIETPSIFLYI